MNLFKEKLKQDNWIESSQLRFASKIKKKRDSKKESEDEKNGRKGKEGMERKTD